VKKVYRSYPYMVAVELPVIKPFAATELNAVITWNGTPPNELEFATFIVESIEIAPPLTEQVAGTAVVDSPALAIGK
jgi:hypothetical protein